MTSPDMPTRMYMDDEEYEWRQIKPDFAGANQRYVQEKLNRHAEGSLEKTVENLIKTMEMEAGHKKNIEQWKSMNLEKFSLRVNGGEKYTAQDMHRLGTYPPLLKGCTLYDFETEKEDRDSADTEFRKCFTTGFAWELLELFSGPPRVSFTWRHWSNFTGPYKGHEPNGKLIELYGATFATVDDDLKLCDVEMYYDPNPMMMILTHCPALGRP